jgi:nicotinamide-nucleotide amidase
MDWEHIERLIANLAAKLTARSWWLATAESCTGGLIASELTNISGSSDWYVGGVVAYSNSIKEELLGVPPPVITANGAVSREVVLAMAQGAAMRFKTQCSLAVSGVAGPTGGTPEKPVGTVWIGWSVNGVVTAELFHFSGDRLSVKRQSALAALSGMSTLLG